jgi:predicted DNA-binding WGR domain protein
MIQRLAQHDFTAESMSAIILHRTDPAQNMRRFYRLDVQPDLLGQWCVIREWGRIGRAGQVRMVLYATAADAHEALAQQQRVKERRGYRTRLTLFPLGCECGIAEVSRSGAADG